MLFALPQHSALDALSFGLMQHQLNLRFFCDKAMELKRAYSNAPSLCVMWCCGVSKLHICHVVLAEASITNSVSAAIAKSVLRPENWDMSKQMLWRNGTPSQRYPVLIPASLFFASTRGAWPCLLPAKILMLACSVEKMSLTESSVRAPEAACLRFAFDSVYLPVLSKCIYRSMQKQKKRWHPSTYIKLPEPGIR